MLLPNAIVDNVIKDESISDMVRILDRPETGTIIETGFVDGADASQNYLNFYFTDNGILFEDALQKIKFGAVMLHNSWTPEDYKALDLEGIFKSRVMLSKLLRYAIGSKI